MKRLLKISFILPLLFLAFAVFSQQQFQKAFFELNQKNYKLEIAESTAQRSLGLMHRNHLASDQGMLFHYQSPGQYRIWMKNTLIPLTVLWLDHQAVIQQKKLLQPCQSDPCKAYGRHSNIQFILELNAGEYDRFKPGDQLLAIKQWAEVSKKN